MVVCLGVFLGLLGLPLAGLPAACFAACVPPYASLRFVPCLACACAFVCAVPCVLGLGVLCALVLVLCPMLLCPWCLVLCGVLCCCCCGGGCCAAVICGLGAVVCCAVAWYIGPLGNTHVYPRVNGLNLPCLPWENGPFMRIPMENMQL